MSENQTSQPATSQPAINQPPAAASQQPQPAAPAERPYRSPSSMGTYFRCGEYWKRQYIDKDRRPPALVMLKGSGMHKGAQVNFAQKLATHEDLPLQDIVDAAVAGFDAELQKSDCTLSEQEQSLGKEVAIGMARDEVKQFAAAFTITQAPDYQPIEVERKFRIPVPRATHDVLGVIDLVATIRDEPGRRLRDFKTARKRKSAIDAAVSDQLTCYAAGHMVEFGEAPRDVGLDVLVKTTKGTSRQELVEQRDQKDFIVLSNKLNAMDAGIKAGIFLPADNGHWFCRASMCPYHADGSCPYVNSERAAAAKATEDAE